MTSHPHWQLAQLNVGRLRAPLEAPAMAEFVARLAALNAMGEGAAGFVWRVPSLSPPALHPLGDGEFVVNMSVWESVEALRAFVYEGAHLQIMRSRRAWFERLAEAHVVLWWVPRGHVPTVAEAAERLAAIRREGAGPGAFGFGRPFPPPTG